MKMDMISTSALLVIIVLIRCSNGYVVDIVEESGNHVT